MCFLLVGLMKLSMAKVFSLGKPSCYWLVCEKPNEARDNGYYFFRYCMINKENKNVFYLIEKNSYDMKKLQQYQENVIYANSFRHCVMYFLSSKLVSSQSLPFPFSERLCKIFFKVKGQKYYWLQHGITKDCLNPKDMSKEYKEYSFVSCASPYEAKFFCDYFGYDEKSAINTGFCRFDGLEDLSKEKKQILIMPTFRKWLACSSVVSRPSMQEEKKFKSSSYYAFYRELLSKISVDTSFVENEIKFVFYQHYAFQPFSYLFKDLELKNIVVADCEHFDVQQLMRESRVLITDYSSVLFDFSYMKKPEIYCQFDRDEYRANHYKEGYFSYERDGFGKCCSSVNETLASLSDIVAKDFKLEDAYKFRIEKFFGKTDANCCQRVYDCVEMIS